MNIKAVVHILGALLFFLGLSMLFPLGFSLYFGDGDATALGSSALISMAAGLLAWSTMKVEQELGIRDSFAVVTLGWVVMAAFGALPFLLSGTVDSPTDAYFETMSGMTTTGATILTDIEGIPRGILFWRSLTHWLGGMGIIVLSLAILPMLGVGGMQLFKAEVPGPVSDKLSPRVQSTAKILWGVYVLFSGIETVLLMAGGMSFFDSLCHAFGTMATGGFSTKNMSIGHFDSAYLDFVIIIFMLIAGTNFALHYRFLKGNWKCYLQDKEFLFYISIVGIATLIIGLDIGIRTYDDIGLSIRAALFQSASITTTTGFGTADFEGWSYLSQFMLFGLMFVGGCAGSTGGSIKNIRVILLFKQSIVELKRLIHPEAVIPVRLGGRSIPADVVGNVLSFFIVYMFSFFAATLIMSLLGLDIVSALTAAAATLGNIGPGLGSIGPTDNYAHIPTAGKWVLSVCMLLGRLELFTVLVLFTPEFWRK